MALPALAAVPHVQAAATASRIRPGLVAYSFRKQLAARSMTYESVIRFASENGLEGLDTTVYWFPDTSPAYLASLRAAAFKNAVQLYSIAVRVRLCQPTAELQAAEFENARKWIDVAVAIGASHVRIFGGSIPKGATETQSIGWAVEVLKRAAEYAGGKGVFLGVEDDGGLTTTAEPTIAIVQGAASPWAGINLDIGNFPRNGYAQVEKCIPYATSVHFKTEISGVDGKKEKADWNRLVGMFAKAGYKGFLSIEYEEHDNAETAVPLLATELRACLRKVSP